jgi:uncharacterized phiE125 gp8 family phage protein
MSTAVVALDWALSVLSREAATAEPVTEAELRQQLRVDELVEAAYVLRLGRAARHAIERYTHRAWAEQVLAVEVQGINQPVVPLPLSWPFRSIVAVTYIDSNGATQTLNSNAYTLTLGTTPVTLDLAVAPDSSYYKIRYQVGHNAAPPEDIKHAILALARWLYDQPAGAMPEARYSSQLAGNDMPPMIRMLCDPYRLEVRTW